MQQRCLLVKTLKPKILENINMEEKYYNTLSLARSGVILPQNFFFINKIFFFFKKKIF